MYESGAIVTCCPCRAFTANQRSPEAGIGKCAISGVRDGHRLEAWQVSRAPDHGTPMPPYPHAERICKHFDHRERKPMERKPVESSQIKSIGHDPENNLLEVEFKGRPGSDQPGSVYQYQNFTSTHHEKLMSADSKGSHFGKHVKGVHPFRKQNPDGTFGPWRT